MDKGFLVAIDDRSRIEPSTYNIEQYPLCQCLLSRTATQKPLGSTYRLRTVCEFFIQTLFCNRFPATVSVGSWYISQVTSEFYALLRRMVLDIDSLPESSPSPLDHAVRHHAKLQGAAVAIEMICTLFVYRTCLYILQAQVGNFITGKHRPDPFRPACAILKSVEHLIKSSLV